MIPFALVSIGGRGGEGGREQPGRLRRSSKALASGEAGTPKGMPEICGGSCLFTGYRPA